MSWSSLLAQKLRPDENGNLPRLWFLLGSEPLLAIEAQDAIRAAAFKAGYSERKSFVFEGNADYSPLYEALGDQSLFGEKNLIEVIFPRATIGKNGPAAVEAIIEHADEDKMVVVSLFDYDWTATKKDWFNHLMKAAVCIRTDPIDRNALPRWIMERAKEIGLMKALGARQWQIMLLFYLEAASSGLAGGALGCIAGWGLAKAIGVMLFDAPLNFAWIVVPCVLVIAVLIALIGTWFPARRIARLYPVEVLYGR